jgi:hypothetical protein
MPTDKNAQIDTAIDGMAETSPVDKGGEWDTPIASDSAITEDAPPICHCIQGKHCNENNECVDDVCLDDSITCASPTDLKKCNEDGSAFEIVPCEGDRLCFLGECIVPVCDPEDPPVCEDGKRKVCNSQGVGYNYLPCPGKTFCVDGECEAIEPNVILILDTSGSMNAIDNAGTLPDECEGADCPSWDWPNCDNAPNPQTRLGKMKAALLSVLDSDGANGLRMALQRFPQMFDLFSLLSSSNPTCDGAPLRHFDLFSGDNTQTHLTHVIQSGALDDSSLTPIMPVPFASDDASNVDTIRSWVDSEHTYELSEETCTILTNCEDYNASMACVDGSCGTETGHELRAMGNTPLGRSIFYAGEIFRERVVLEGKACAEESDCDSPHYSCVDGVCHDPYRECRPNVVILFSDGGETLDLNPALFFHARIQAKRLHYGLGCSTDQDCMNGATCPSGVCTSDDLSEPAKVCRTTNVPCAANGECTDFPYPCGGSASTCSGKCETTGVDFIDEVGENVLRDPAGNLIPVTIHVVDAAQSLSGTSLIAQFGGGEHIVVDIDDVGSIVSGFTGALDIKVESEACIPQGVNEP